MAGGEEHAGTQGMNINSETVETPPFRVIWGRSSSRGERDDADARERLSDARSASQTAANRGPDRERALLDRGRGVAAIVVELVGYDPVLPDRAAGVVPSRHARVRMSKACGSGHDPAGTSLFERSSRPRSRATRVPLRAENHGKSRSLMFD